MAPILRLAFLILILSSSWTCRAVAEESLIIQDTSGFTRAAADVDHVGNINFELAGASGSPVTGAEVKLTNALTQESIVVTSDAGVASFQSVPAGTWTVSTTATDVTFTNVAIVDALAPAAAGVGVGTMQAVGIGAAGVTGATAATISVVDATKSEHNEDDPLPLSPVS